MVTPPQTAFQNFAQERADQIKERRMTEQQTTPEPAFVPVAATATDRLAQLHAAYNDAKVAFDQAKERLDAVKDGIKAELVAVVPEGSTKIALSGDDGPTLTLVYAERVTFDSRRFKLDDPENYVRYAKFGGAWTLTAAKGGASE